MYGSYTQKIFLGVFLLIVAVPVTLILLAQKDQQIPVPEVSTENVIESSSRPVRPYEEKVIGSSVEGRPITVFEFGKGETNLLFIGGIHGGYEWNSVLLAYEFIDFLTEYPGEVPENLTVSIIPSLNPDGVYAVIGAEGRFSSTDLLAVKDTSVGRFNARGVDLNRNFDCKWQSEAVWRGNSVSAGDAPFSEPEAETLRTYVYEMSPAAVVLWHSKANAIYASECMDGILPGTRIIMNIYGDASGYTKVDIFDAYPVTGDAEGWLASIGIPAITVELSTHEAIEWDKNIAGMRALLRHFTN